VRIMAEELSNWVICVLQYHFVRVLTYYVAHDVYTNIAGDSMFIIAV